MKKSLLSLAIVSALGLSISGVASASPVAMNNGVDFGNNGSTQTSEIDNFAFNNTVATSFYLGAATAGGIAVGTQVIDTNIGSIMTANGFTPGTKPTLSGGSTTVNFPSIPTGLNVNTIGLVEPSGPVADGNGFTAGEAGIPYGTTLPGLAGGNLWGLTYDYVLYGQTTATEVKYTSGYFDLFYNDGTVNNQVLRLDVTGSTTTGVSLLLNGKINFDWTNDGVADGGSFAQDFWKDARPGGTTLFDMWLVDPASVSWALSTAVTPALPRPDQLFVADGNYARQSQLDGQFAFNVPEPGSLALLGLGLAGLGLAQRRRKAAR